MTSVAVTTNILDLRAEPDHASERVNQCLFGDIVAQVSSRAGFVKVRKADGYIGWADRRFVISISTAKAEDFQKRINCQVASLSGRLYDLRGQTTAPNVLYYGTRLRTGKAQDGRVGVSFPDGRRFQIKATHLQPIQDSTRQRLSGARLAAEGRKFLGVPYLWGGITTTGFDCSGLVWAVCRRFGIYLPRDTKDQIRSGTPVSQDGIKTGDLLFFERHVGFAVGSMRILHASRGGGGVRLESVDPADRACRKDLLDTFVTARRIV